MKANNFSKKINLLGNLLSSTERIKKINKILNQLLNRVESLENEFLRIMKIKMKINKSEINVKKYAENIEEKEVKNSRFAVPKIAVNDILIDNINENKEKIKDSNRKNNYKKQNDTNVKLRELETLNSSKFESVKIINPVNEKLFNINNEFLCLDKNNRTPFKLFDNDISKYYIKFKNVIELKDCNELFQVITSFKYDIAMKYNFTKLINFCDIWLNRIQKEENFDSINANFNDIQKILNIMKYQFNFYNNSKNSSENLPGQNENILSIYMKNDDNILRKLRAFKFSYLKECSDEQLEKGIKKLLISEKNKNKNENENENNNQKAQIKLRNNKNLSKRYHNIRNEFIDSNPFNQNNDLCKIF